MNALFFFQVAMIVIAVNGVATILWLAFGEDFEGELDLTLYDDEPIERI